MNAKRIARFALACLAGPVSGLSLVSLVRLIAAASGQPWNPDLAAVTTFGGVSVAVITGFSATFWALESDR